MNIDKFFELIDCRCLVCNKVLNKTPYKLYGYGNTKYRCASCNSFNVMTYENNISAVIIFRNATSDLSLSLEIKTSTISSKNKPVFNNNDHRVLIDNFIRFARKPELIFLLEGI